MFTGKCQTASCAREHWRGKEWEGNSCNGIRRLRSKLIDKRQEFHWRPQSTATLALKIQALEKKEWEQVVKHFDYLMRHIFQAWARYKGNLPSCWTSYILPDILIICHLVCYGVTVFGNYKFGKVPDIWTTHGLRPLHTRNGARSKHFIFGLQFPGIQQWILRMPFFFPPIITISKEITGQ